MYWRWYCGRTGSRNSSWGTQGQVCIPQRAAPPPHGRTSTCGRMLSGKWGFEVIITYEGKLRDWSNEVMGSTSHWGHYEYHMWRLFIQYCFNNAIWLIINKSASVLIGIIGDLSDWLLALVDNNLKVIVIHSDTGYDGSLLVKNKYLLIQVFPLTMTPLGRGKSVTVNKGHFNQWFLV